MILKCPFRPPKKDSSTSSPQNGVTRVEAGSCATSTSLISKTKQLLSVSLKVNYTPLLIASQDIQIRGREVVEWSGGGVRSLSLSLVSFLSFLRPIVLHRVKICSVRILGGPWKLAEGRGKP